MSYAGDVHLDGELAEFLGYGELDGDPPWYSHESRALELVREMGERGWDGFDCWSGSDKSYQAFFSRSDGKRRRVRVYGKATPALAIAWAALEALKPEGYVYPFPFYGDYTPMKELLAELKEAMSGGAGENE